MSLQKMWSVPADMMTTEEWQKLLDNCLPWLYGYHPSTAAMIGRVGKNIIIDLPSEEEGFERLIERLKAAEFSVDVIRTCRHVRFLGCRFICFEVWGGEDEA